MTTADPVPGCADALRAVMSRFESGVTVVSALRAGVRHAMTATAVTAVSLDPPLVLVCVSKASRFYGAISTADGWCLSILAAGQAPVARHFANSGRDLLTQFDQVGNTPAPASGAPRLTGALAWLDCRTWAGYDGGDHTIVVGEVVWAGGAEVDDRAALGPLTYYRGSYRPTP